MTSNNSWLNSASRTEQERLHRYLSELKEQQQKSKLHRHKANPGFQQRFIRSSTQGRLILVGNQEGKTEIGAFEASSYALGEHPHKHIRIPNIGWVITAKPLKEGVEKELLPKITGLVGSEDIRAIKNNSQGIPYKILWRSGSTTFMLSAEQDDKVFEGSTIDWCWFDEPMRRSIYIAVRRGLMKAGGHWWWSMTPLDEPWIYDELYDKALKGSKEIEIFEGNPGENVHVPAEERQRFKESLTEEEIETRIYGKFRHLSGRVFKTYDPQRHKVPSFDIPRHWPVWAATDPHTRKPHAVLFLACAPTGAFYVCNEIFTKVQIEELGQLSLDIGSQYKLVERLIDTSGQEEDWRRESAREILQNVGWRTKLAQKKNKKKSGILKINQLFAKNQLFVMEHCLRTHKELMLQTYRKSHARDGRLLEEPEKNWDDMTDCLRYILTERPDYNGPGQIKERQMYTPEVRYGR